MTSLKSAKYLQLVQLRRSDLEHPWTFPTLTPPPLSARHLVQPSRLGDAGTFSDLRISGRRPR